MSGCQLRVILWAFNQGSAPFTLTKTSSLAWCLDANSRLLSFRHLTKVLAFLPSQKLRHLLDVWMLTQGCFPWALNQGSGPVTVALYFHLFKILMLVIYLIGYFHWVVKFLVHFFRELSCSLLSTAELQDWIVRKKESSYLRTLSIKKNNTSQLVYLAVFSCLFEFLFYSSLENLSCYYMSQL